LTFKKQTIRGFWLVYCYQSAKRDEITAMFDQLAPLVASGTILTPVVATSELLIPGGGGLRVTERK
jgi:hypothetical protein